MYNKSFRCTYLEKDSLELYQNELLKAFECENVDQLIPAMTSLHQTMHTKELTQLIQKINLINIYNDNKEQMHLFDHLSAHLVVLMVQ